MGLTLVISICLCIVFYHMITNGAEGFLAVKDKFVSIMLPIIDGIAIAYLMNPVMMYIEERIVRPLYKKSRHYQKNKKTDSIIRGIAVFFSMVIFFLIIVGLILLIVPQLVNSIESIVSKLPSYMNSLNIFLSKSLSDHPYIAELFDTYSDQVEDFVTDKIIPMLQSTVSSISSSIFASVYEILVNAFKFIIGSIISIYLLYRKDLHLAQIKKIVYAYMPQNKADTFISNSRYINQTLGGFISGKLVDSLIIGIICFICMNILKLPYPLLISCIVGATNVIPYFGPFIGAVPSAFLVLLINPRKCLIFLIFILILQQFDGNILGPKILGESTGLSSFWVIFSITLFGGLFGFVGMFLGVPVFAVIYSAFKTYIETRLKKRNLPTETSYYYDKSDYIPKHTFKKNRKTANSNNPEAADNSDHFRLNIEESMNDNSEEVKSAQADIIQNTGSGENKES